MKKRIISAFLALTLMLSVFAVTGMAASTTLKLNVTKATIGVGETLQIKATTNSKSTVTWSSSDKSIVKVDKTGLATAKKTGKVTLTAKVDNVKASCTITVKKAPSKITLNTKDVSLTKGESYTLTYTLPSGTMSRKVTYATSDKKVATVSSKGVITATGEGTCKIQAKTFNGKKVTVSVEVIDNSNTSVVSETAPDNGEVNSKVSVSSFDGSYIFQDGDIYASRGIEYEGWIYFANSPVKGFTTPISYIFKTLPDGNNFTILSYPSNADQEVCGYYTFTVSDGWIYYCKSTYVDDNVAWNVVRIDLNGENEENANNTEIGKKWLAELDKKLS